MEAFNGRVGLVTGVNKDELQAPVVKLKTVPVVEPAQLVASTDQ